jgi:hypothetical protein
METIKELIVASRVTTFYCLLDCSQSEPSSNYDFGYLKGDGTFSRSIVVEFSSSSSELLASVLSGSSSLSLGSLGISRLLLFSFSNGGVVWVQSNTSSNVAKGVGLLW